MKKTIILTLMITFTLAGMAQKGSWYIGGLAGFGTTTDKDQDGDKIVMSNWALGPEFGTFLNDDLSIGFVTGLSGASRKVADEKDYNRTAFSPTVYVRHFYRFTDIFSAFGGVYLGFISGTRKDYTYPQGSETEYKTTSSGVSIRLGVGVAFALSPRFTAVGQYGLLGYSSVGYKNNDGEKTLTENSFDFGVNTVGGSTLSQGNGSGSVFNVGIYYTIKQ